MGPFPHILTLCFEYNVVSATSDCIIIQIKEENSPSFYAIYNGQHGYNYKEILEKLGKDAVIVGDFNRKPNSQFCLITKPTTLGFSYLWKMGPFSFYANVLYFYLKFISTRIFGGISQNLCQPDCSYHGTIIDNLVSLTKQVEFQTQPFSSSDHSAIFFSIWLNQNLHHWLIIFP